MKPLLKWVGGKTQILNQVLDQIPNQLQNYHEPFIGGGSVLLGVLSSKTIQGVCYASDINPHLIDFYKTIQSTPEEFITQMKQLVEDYKQSEDKEKFYYSIREKFNTSTENRAVMFLFLNKTCFRGVYREGPHGFNVPFGHYKTFDILDEEHVRNVSILIKNVVFTCQSFEESLKMVKKGDFVYLDPPYVPEQTNSFVNYTAHGFKMEDHMKLFDDIKKLPCSFSMSNSDVEFVRQQFSNYSIISFPVRRAIHSKDPSTKTNEVIISQNL